MFLYSKPIHAYNYYYIGNMHYFLCIIFVIIIIVVILLIIQDNNNTSLNLQLRVDGVMAWGQWRGRRGHVY